MKNWKTTSTGILAIAGAFVALWFKQDALSESVIMASTTSILTGIGLIFAQDSKR